MQRRRWSRWVVLLVLFVAYQAPEGIGQRLLESFAVQAGLLLLFFPVAWALGRARGYRGFDAYALERRPGGARWLGLTLLVAFATKAAAVGAGLWLGVYAPGETPAASAQVGLAVLGIVFTTFWPSVAEDVLTRGFWYRQVPELGRGLGFVLFTALFYVLNHVYRLQAGPLEWAMLFAFGVAYAGVLVRAETLWAAVGLHWGWNIAAFTTSDVFGIGTQDEALAPLLSAVAHLVALGVVLLLGRGLPGQRHSKSPAEAQAG